jgi:hypothetical protein
MVGGEDRAQQAGRAPDVAHRLVPGEVELLGQRLEVGPRDPLHRGHELLEPRRVAVELLEHRPAGVHDLVLGPAGPQRLGQVSPESVQARVRHLEDPSDVRGAPLVQRRRFGRVAIAALAPDAIALEELQGDERVDEVVDRSRMEAEPLADLLTGHRVVTESREQLQPNGRQQRLRRPEPHADLHDVGGIEVCSRHGARATRTAASSTGPELGRMSTG